MYTWFLSIRLMVWYQLSQMHWPSVMHTQETNDFATGQKLTEAMFELQQINWKLVSWVEFSEGKKRMPLKVCGQNSV